MHISVLYMWLLHIDTTYVYIYILIHLLSITHIIYTHIHMHIYIYTHFIYIYTYTELYRHMTYDICMYVGEKKLSESSIFDAETPWFC